MLIIVNCRVLYAYPWIAYLLSDLRPTNNKVVVCGTLSDYDSGKIESAQASFRAVDYEICQEHNLRSHQAMLSLLMQRQDVTTRDCLIVTDIPADQQAGAALGLVCIQPLLFGITYEGLIAHE